MSRLFPERSRYGSGKPACAITIWPERIAFSPLRVTHERTHPVTTIDFFETFVIRTVATGDLPGDLRKGPRNDQRRLRDCNDVFGSLKTMGAALGSHPFSCFAKDRDRGSCQA
jgi:hypothetical protein